MDNINQQVEKYLDFYLEQVPPKNYAILLDGEWGAGKTHFIKNFCLQPLRAQKKFIYISLYGVSKASEIDDQIFQQLHPVLSNKYVSLVSKVAKGALKVGLKVDLDGASQDVVSGDISIPNVSLKDLANSAKDAVLIFDDLERCSIPVEKILGWINYFCEHQNHRTIIIANEKEIKKNKKYNEIKEKLIGRVFLITADASEALDSFIENINVISVKQFLLEQKDTILNIYMASRYQNLRSLKQAIIEWPQFYENLPSKAQDNKELLKQALRDLLILSFEIRKGKLALEEIKDISNRGYSYALSKKKDEPNPYVELEKKYVGFYFNQLCPNDYCWYSFFKDGAIEKEILNKSINESSFFAYDNKPDWYKLLHFSDLQEDDFEKLIKQVGQNFESEKYQKFGEIKHVVSTLLFFARRKMILKQPAKIISEAKRIVKKMEKNQSLIYGKTIDFGLQDAYAGIVFLSNEDAEFKNFTAFLKELEKNNEEKNYPAMAQSVIKIAETDGYAFWQAMSQKTATNRYHDIPILNSIAPREFVAAFLKCPNESKRYISYGFKERYQFISSYTALLEEKGWVQSVKKLLEQEKKGAGPLKKYHIDWFLEHALNFVLKNMIQLEKVSK